MENRNIATEYGTTPGVPSYVRRQISVFQVRSNCNEDSANGLPEQLGRAG